VQVDRVIDAVRLTAGCLAACPAHLTQHADSSEKYVAEPYRRRTRTEFARAPPAVPAAPV
jgi:hypothetical protein